MQPIKVKEGRIRRRSEDPRRLTSREREVAQLLALGHQQTEIARQLHVSPRTIERHVLNARGKTGTGSAFELAVKVVRGEIDVESD